MEIDPPSLPSLGLRVREGVGKGRGGREEGKGEERGGQNLNLMNTRFTQMGIA